MLSKCKGLCTTQLAALLFDTTKAPFTCRGVFLCTHLDVILWRAPESMVLEKVAVSSIEDVDLWIAQERVSMCIDCAVFVTKKLRPVEHRQLLNMRLGIVCTYMSGAR